MVAYSVPAALGSCTSRIGVDAIERYFSLILYLLLLKTGSMSPVEYELPHLEPALHYFLREICVSRER